MTNTIHSKFLIHWTGRDINPYDREIDGDIRKKYIERLKNIIEKGLYVKPGEETIYGVDGKMIKAEIARVCFTEIKLTQTEKHAKLYGGMGIGFNRDFVLEREGNTVFYVQNGCKGHIIENFDVIRGWMNKLPPDAVGSKIEELEIILGYLKGMSCPNENELKYYDEMEWRIVHLNRLTGTDSYIQDYEEKTVDGKNIYRLKVEPKDVQLIIFPDRETLKMALNDEFISNRFNLHNPTLITLDHCKNF